MHMLSAEKIGRPRWPQSFHACDPLCRAALSVDSICILADLQCPGRLRETIDSRNIEFFALSFVCSATCLIEAFKE